MYAEAHTRTQSDKTFTDRHTAGTEICSAHLAGIGNEVQYFTHGGVVCNPSPRHDTCFASIPSVTQTRER